MAYQRHVVIPSKAWQHKTGYTVSIYGAIPWQSPDAKSEWTLINKGWTVRDNVTNTIGLGHAPMSLTEAQDLAEELNDVTI